MSNDDKRLIEDYLPIQAISAEASREKSVRKGHISTLHLWWARRPLVACRAAIYGVLVPASRFRPGSGPEKERARHARANAGEFVERLCKYPGARVAIAEAQQHILEAHAERLTQETGRPVTTDDILAGRAPRPKVLDMFAGGGAIPLEALRLGCEAYALDLNPVAYIIELCTLVYPQKYGKPDRTAKGSAPDGTWAGLAEEVRYWGNWVLGKVKAEIGDLYPPVPDPEAPRTKKMLGEPQLEMAGSGFEQAGQLYFTEQTSVGSLTPIAYLWTRTVSCKNPTCKATVPLVRQTWLCRKEGRCVALKVIAPKGEKRARFKVVEAQSAAGLGFDPEAGSKGGNATCPFCGTVADIEYVKAEGCVGRMGQQMMAVVCTRPGAKGKVYLSASDLPAQLPDDAAIRKRIEELCQRTGLTVPTESIEANPRSMDTQHFGLTAWSDLFTPRQMLCLLTFAAVIREAEVEMRRGRYAQEHADGVVTFLGAMLDKLSDFCSTQCVWNYTGGRGVKNSFGRQALPMTWDFSETCPFNAAGASWPAIGEDIPAAIALISPISPHVANVRRGTATALPWPEATFDAVLTDPPYYDNVSYSNLSDFFFVWLKRTIGHVHPEHFALTATPKKNEVIAAFYRHGGSKERSRRMYEKMMFQSFREAHRVLKPGGQMVVVYAHKTTLGWATLVGALRGAGFTVVEAWPLDTERPGRTSSLGSGALASSIFLVARRRECDEHGQYETVRPELEKVVQERVATLWAMGISGADLVIACVGAGLRAFTRFARVEYANGEEVPPERYLTEVEGVVLDHILAQLSREVAGNTAPQSLAGVGAATRFYTLWRYTYHRVALDAGEAIIFANGTHVELDGPRGLSGGSRPLVEKRKGKYRLRDYTERGGDDRLGLPHESGQPVPLVDTLHRTLWLMENRPGGLPAFLREAQPNREQLRLVAQALAGPALRGGELPGVSPSGELAALTKLLANWQSVVEEAAATPEEQQSRKVRRTGQQQFDFGKEGRS